MGSRSFLSAFFSALRVLLVALVVSQLSACGGAGGGGYGYEGGGDRGTGAERSQIFQGAVSDGAGNAISNASLAIQDQNGEVLATGAADAQGNFSLSVNSIEGSQLALTVTTSAGAFTAQLPDSADAIVGIKVVATNDGISVIEDQTSSTSTQVQGPDAGSTGSEEAAKQQAQFLATKVKFKIAAASNVSSMPVLLTKGAFSAATDVTKEVQALKIPKAIALDSSALVIEVDGHQITIASGSTSGIVYSIVIGKTANGVLGVHISRKSSQDTAPETVSNSVYPPPAPNSSQASGSSGDASTSQSGGGEGASSSSGQGGADSGANQNSVSNGSSGSGDSADAGSAISGSSDPTPPSVGSAAGASQPDGGSAGTSATGTTSSAGSVTSPTAPTGPSGSGATGSLPKLPRKPAP
ncbi:MAG: hypothetical protein K1X79_12880 [Oligoflexia bacterium]|nr:hypothetical protein [Oligoflexia bacterium]